MSVKEWPDVPERYWPDTDRPWRVVWGIGCHQDFRTKREAETFRKTLFDGSDWDKMIRPVFNALKVEVGP